MTGWSLPPLPWFRLIPTVSSTWNHWFMRWDTALSDSGIWVLELVPTHTSMIAGTRANLAKSGLRRDHFGWHGEQSLSGKLRLYVYVRADGVCPRSWILESLCPTVLTARKRLRVESLNEASANLP